MRRPSPARLLPLAALVALAGCDQFFYPAHQTVAVATMAGTGDVKGASCKLSNDKRTWFVTTPAKLTLIRSDQPMFVTCAKPGYETVTIFTEPATKSEMFGAVWSGGLIDLSSDARSGRTSAYSQRIVVKLTPSSEKPAPPPV